MKVEAPNKPDAAKPEKAFQLQGGRQRRGVGELGRWLL